LPELTKEAITAIVAKRHPSTVASLKKCLEDERIKVSDEKLLPLIIQMQSAGEITLCLPALAGSFEEYLTGYWGTWWIYLTMVVAASESLLVFSQYQNGPLLLLRILFGLGMLGFLPGYLTVMIIFPGRQINILEKLALGIFLSVLISIGTGVLLGLGPFFQASNNIFILSVYVILADLTAAYRSYNFLRRAR
jgi:hypothetical protein